MATFVDYDDEWMMDKCGDAVVAHPLFRTESSGSTPTSPLQFIIGIIDGPRAIELNKLWHSHMPEYRVGAAWWHHVKISYVAYFDGKYYAVAIWSKPNARSLPKDWLELRRLAICNEAPKNTATRMLKVMINDIRKRYPEIKKVISYQDTGVHQGTIYKAAGWEIGSKSEAYDWELHGQKKRKWPRPPKEHMNPKIRWEKDIR